MTSFLSLIPLDQTQHDAVTKRGADIVVTAGAGSGKTRTLVARFLALVEEGAPLRSLIAITFTDKAARKMRTDIRENLVKWRVSDANDRRDFWDSASAELDNARIGTIHSLCATILRAHPAEAAVDPGFEVLDENASAAFRAQAIQAALDWMANDAVAVTLFALLKENALREMLTTLLENRSVARATFDAVRDPRAVWKNALVRALAQYTESPDVRDALATLRALKARDELTSIAGVKLAAQIIALLQRWTRIESVTLAPHASAGVASAEGAKQSPNREVDAYAASSPNASRLLAMTDWDTCLRELFAIRRENLGGAVGSKGAVKDAVKVLREQYDEILDLWLGGKNSSDATPRWSLDERAADALPQLYRAFDTAIRGYDALKAERRALDFDDLEAQTVALLENNADVRARWQSETRAILVDEFQDTNDHQRRIIYALRGLGFPISNPSTLLRTSFQSPISKFQPPTSNLFVVGDGKQSIYRFRGGDVTVLRRVQSDLAANGGASFNLDLTYRAHASLVTQLNALLEPILGTADDPARPYAIPFSPLRAHRTTTQVREPFIEFCLGIGEDAEQGRAATANALAARLWRLREEENIGWGDIALLFRASSHYSDYEAAFERANIPFVTVAGKGFYERPEVRDLLNALAAIADPTDDLALAGTLRSPAFGVSDGALYLLRRDGATTRSFGSALHGDLSALSTDDATRAARACEILDKAIGLVGRVSVATMLKYFLDATDYRAILQSVPDAERPRRNVDKLLADAHASGLVSISEFLEYVQTLRDVEAREGEAPVEAGEAVQLMTVHKAKGLEFSIVVLADAAHTSRGARSFYLDPELGPVFAVANSNEHSVMDRLGAQRDADQADAEEKRLLYVAATRAKDKLIVCGPCKRKKEGTLTLGGWLGQLGVIVGLDKTTVPESLDAPIEIELQDIGGKIGCAISPLSQFGIPNSKFQIPTSNLQHPTSTLPSLVASLIPQVTELVDEKIRERDADPPSRIWRVVPTAQRPRGPAWVVGKLVHEALRRWRFPDRADFEVFLYPHALATGLTDRREIASTISEARRLLERFQSHELYAEMNNAERFHELPYTRQHNGRGDVGVIDVLYSAGEAWRVVDFKTDDIRDEEKLNAKITEYREQVMRYADAVSKLVGTEPQASLCFLDAFGTVRVELCDDAQRR